MDLATIVGMVIAVTVVLIAIFLGGDFLLFVNVPSILIVIGGTAAATIIRFPLKGVLVALGVGGKVAFKQDSTSPLQLIEEITDLAEIIRKKGPLGLEGVQVENELLAKGVQFVTDGYDKVFIMETLERERDLTLERLKEGKTIFKAIGDAAPAFGMIGTLVGLVQMLATMDDPASIGPSMAVALLTTLYGAFIANVIALPIADKLDIKSKIEEINLTLSIDGIIQIYDNKSPNMIKEMLIAYLPEKHRADIMAAA